jgi:uncharacterized protein DUF3237
VSNSISDLALPQPELRLVYRMRAELGEPLDLGVTPAGHRKLVPLTGGRFEGPELAGTVLPGGSADWQIVQPDGSVFVEIRYTLRTDDGALLMSESRGVRHGPPDVLERIVRGEEVAPDEYTYRTAVSIETSASQLRWLNHGVFVCVGAREPGAVVYEVYLVA